MMELNFFLPTSLASTSLSTAHSTPNVVTTQLPGTSVYRLSFSETSFLFTGILAKTAHSGDWKDQEEGKFPPGCMDWELRMDVLTTLHKTCHTGRAQLSTCEIGKCWCHVPHSYMILFRLSGPQS